MHCRNIRNVHAGSTKVIEGWTKWKKTDKEVVAGKRFWHQIKSIKVGFPIFFQKSQENEPEMQNHVQYNQRFIKNRWQKRYSRL